MVWRKLANIVAVVLVMWLAVVFGVGTPLNEQDLLGKTRKQVIDEHGQPAAVFKRQKNGNNVLVYYDGWILKAQTDVEFKNGIVVKVVGHSPHK